MPVVIVKAKDMRFEDWKQYCKRINKKLMTVLICEEKIIIRILNLNDFNLDMREFDWNDNIIINKE